MIGSHRVNGVLPIHEIDGTQGIEPRWIPAPSFQHRRDIADHATERRDAAERDGDRRDERVAADRPHGLAGRHVHPLDARGNVVEEAVVHELVFGVELPVIVVMDRRLEMVHRAGGRLDCAHRRWSWCG